MDQTAIYVQGAKQVTLATGASSCHQGTDFSWELMEGVI